MYFRTGGWVCLPEPVPSTGSRPIRADNFGDFCRAKAKEVLPPRLWPARAILVRFGLTCGGRCCRRPVGSQFITAAVALISSLASGPATVYNCTHKFILVKLIPTKSIIST